MHVDVEDKDDPPKWQPSKWTRKSILIQWQMRENYEMKEKLGIQIKAVTHVIQKIKT